MGSIGIGIAGSQWVEPLRPESLQGMIAVGRMPLVMPRCCEAGGAATRAVKAAEQKGAKVRRQGPTLKIGAHGMASNGRKTPLVWSRMCPRQTFCGLYGIGFAQNLFYQRLEKGLPFFMNNSG